MKLLVKSLFITALGVKAENNLLSDEGFLFAGTTGSKCLQVKLGSNSEDPCGDATLVFGNLCGDHLDGASYDADSLAVAQWTIVNNPAGGDDFYLVNSSCQNNQGAYYGVGVSYQESEFRKKNSNKLRQIEEMSLTFGDIAQASTFIYENNKLKLASPDESIDSKFNGVQGNIVMGFSDVAVDESNNLCQMSYFDSSVVDGDVTPMMYLELDLISSEFGIDRL